MKIFKTALAGSLVLLSTAVFSNAQEDKNEGKPATRQEAKPASEEAKPATGERRAQEQSKDEKQIESKDRKQENEASHNQQRNDQKAEERGKKGNNGGTDRAKNTQRIPDDKFRAHFGREHQFRVSQPVVVEGRPRVQYSGYWFEFVDTWPAGWSYSDDCYIDYVDGEYFMFDLLHPETRIAVVVIL